MAAPHEILASLEGLAGVLVGTSDVGPQPIMLWIKQIKEIMLQVGLRNLEDWEIKWAYDVDEDGSNEGLIEGSAGTLYGLLATNLDKTGAQAAFLVAQNLSSLAVFAGESALDNDVLFCTQLPLADTDGTNKWATFTFPHGLVFGTGISLNADGVDGQSPAANDIKVLAIYRTN